MSAFAVFEYKVSASEIFAGAYYYFKKMAIEIVGAMKKKAEKEFVVVVVGKM